MTILVRLIIGPLCDRYGPRKAYTGLLLVGAIPVFGVAWAWSRLDDAELVAEPHDVRLALVVTEEGPV